MNKHFSTSWIIRELKIKWDIKSHPLGYLVSKRKEISINKVIEKRELLYTVGVNVYWFKHYEKQHGDFSKIKNITTMWSSNPLSFPREMKSLLELISMVIATLFTMAKIWKQFKCLSTNKWIKETWSIHTYKEYYLAL